MPFTLAVQPCLEKREGIKYSLPCALHAITVSISAAQRKAFAAMLGFVPGQSRGHKGVACAKLHQDVQPHSIHLEPRVELMSPQFPVLQVPGPGAPREGKITLHLAQLYFKIINTEYI